MRFPRRDGQSRIKTTDTPLEKKEKPEDKLRPNAAKAQRNKIEGASFPNFAGVRTSPEKLTTGHFFGASA